MVSGSIQLTPPESQRTSMWYSQLPGSSSKLRLMSRTVPQPERGSHTLIGRVAIQRAIMNPDSRQSLLIFALLLEVSSELLA